MISSNWFLRTISVIAVIKTSTEALQQRDVEPRRCYLCNNESECKPQATWPSASCSAQRPYCATIAGSPNFTSFLTCTESIKKPCLLTYAEQKRGYQMHCACPNHLCNAPFSQQLQNELIMFSSSNTPVNGSTDYSDLFWQHSHFNVTENIYKIITARMHSEVETFTGISSLGTMAIDDAPQYLEDLINVPRVEPLKLEMTTMPSDDDDDDDGEGSGSEYTERTPTPSHEPAAPVSHLPASESSAPYIFINIAAPALLLLYTTL